jgi:TolB-like protein/Tfp pilus assembly protein PilF
MPRDLRHHWRVGSKGVRVDGFWLRLKQRKLVQWSAAYIAGSFALIQVLDVVAQRFGWPGRVEKLVILGLAVGFFVTLVLAWYHGDRGAQRVGGTELLIIALLLAIGGGGLWVYAGAPQVPAEPAVAAARSLDAAKRNPGTIPGGLPGTTAEAAGSGLRIAQPASAASIPEKSVAVLPFANESGKQDQQFFSDGLSQDLITALSQFAGLKVINRDSAFQFRDSKDSIKVIAQKLGVAHLLEGSVQKQGGEVRITATLVDAADGSILWSQRYDKPYKDLFALQDDITHSVADALEAKLLTAPGAVVQSERPPSGKLAAWQAYQQGRFYEARFTRAGFREAIGAYTEATHLDPRYATAYAAMAEGWIGLAIQYLSGDAKQQAYARARQAIKTALQLAPDSALAHAARADLLRLSEFDWRGAQAEYLRAAQLAPNDPSVLLSLASMEAARGRVRSAVDLTRKALSGDPLNANWHLYLSEYLAGLGRLDEAQQAAEKAIELQPTADSVHEQLTMFAILRDHPQAALAAAQQEKAPGWRRVALALAAQIGPDRAAADTALQTLIARDSEDAPYQVADVYALRRDPDDMFKWLDRAWSSRDPGISYLLYDPLILRYKDDPRFAAFCRKVGLPTATDAVAM